MTDADRERLARLVIRKGLDCTVPHPELRPADFISAWLDGEIRLDDLRERMGLTGIQLRRMRLAAAEAAAAELGRLGVWASGRLGVWASGRLGVWASGRLGVEATQRRNKD